MNWSEALACPVCKGELSFADGLACGSCDRSYALASGIPILLPEAGPPTSSHKELETLASLPGPLLDVALVLRRYLTPELTYKAPASRELIPAFVSSTRGPILNVGSGTTRYGSHVLNLDVSVGPTVDVVGVAEALPLRGEWFGGAILQAVLEHVEDASATLGELNRVLRPGGSLIVDVPFMQGYHGAPSDFRRFTELGLKNELERHGFDVEKGGVSVGPGSATAWILSEYLALALSRGPRSYRTSRLVTRWLGWPLKWTDAWLSRHPMGFVVAGGVWAQGTKRD